MDIISIIQGVVIILIAALIVHVMGIMRKGLQKIKKTAYIVTIILILLVAATDYLTMVSVRPLLPDGVSFPVSYWLILAGSFLVKIALVVLLLYLIKNISLRLPPEKDSAMIAQFSVRLCNKGGDDNSVQKIKVRQLDSGDLPSTDRLELDWPTFIEGMRRLKQQMKNRSPNFNPDLYVGINLGGTIIASYLSGTRGAGKRVGSIHTEGDDHEVTEISLPDKATKVNRILVTDGSVIRGKSLVNVFKALNEYFGDQTSPIRIKIAVLTACKVSGEISEMTELCNGKRGAFEEDWDYLPDYLAYVYKGITRLPEDIR